MMRSVYSGVPAARQKFPRCLLSGTPNPPAAIANVSTSSKFSIKSADDPQSIPSLLL